MPEEQQAKYLLRSVRWVTHENMSRGEMVANVLISGVGALGQGVWLAHILDAYPFKILNSPPSQFYSSVGLVLGFTAPLVSLLALRIFRAMRPPFLIAVPLVACPLIFFVLFKIVFALSSYHYASHGSDLIASKATEGGFAQVVFWLTLSGCAIGLACGVAIRFVFRKLAREVD